MRLRLAADGLAGVGARATLAAVRYRLRFFIAWLWPLALWAEVVRIGVPAAATDAAITLVPGEHGVWLNREVPPRGELLLFFTGTGGRGGPAEFLRTAADLGYHVIVPLYVNDIAAAVCRDDEDPAAFENFRREIIEGRDLSPRLAVDRANSLENRVVQLVRWLAANRTGEGWVQFLDERGELRWRQVVLAGHSQGGGHALLMAQDREVARVVMTGAPKDYSQAAKRPAAWYRPGLTPARRWFALVHERDAQGCSWAEQLENFRATGLAPVASVDEGVAPFGGAHALTTAFGGELASGPAHSSVVNHRRFRPVWEFMLTVSVD